MPPEDSARTETLNPATADPQPTPEAGEVGGETSPQAGVEPSPAAGPASAPACKDAALLQESVADSGSAQAATPTNAGSEASPGPEEEPAAAEPSEPKAEASGAPDKAAAADAEAEGSPAAPTGARATASGGATPPPTSAEDATPAAAESAAEEPTEKAAEEPTEKEGERSELFVAMSEARDQKKPMLGKVIGWNKGGFHVALDGVPAFCPKSQIEIGNPKKSNHYLNQEYTFRIIEVRNDGKRIVVSRAEILKEELDQERQETNKKLVVGAVLEGKISSLTDFGAFVDLGGGIEGLVHLSKLSRRRVGHPREILRVGDPATVQVIKLENDGTRISLSMKDLEPDPWEGVEETYTAGGTFEGSVVRRADFGLFVELQPGLEGLIHTSQLPFGVSLDDPSVAVGQRVSGWIRSTDRERRRLSLTLREISESDPWTDLADRFPEGTEVEGTIEQVAKFGLFVQLQPGLTGLLPFSQMSLPAGSQPQRTHIPGQTITVQVSSVDTKRKRISLAPRGSRLEGTKADYRDYQKKQKTPKSDGGLNAMAAAFAKLQRPG